MKQLTVPSKRSGMSCRRIRVAPRGCAWLLGAVLAWPGLIPADEPATREDGLTVWTLPSWTRALRADPPGGAREAQLYAARGEWESFQLAVRSEREMRIVSLSLAALESEDGKSIPGSQIRLYRAHQLHIAEATHRNDAFREGWYPDALIPLEVPSSRGSATEPGPRYRGVPFPLPAGETHSFWIDVHVPDDAAEGDYRGTLRLEVVPAGGGSPIAVEVPVEVRVWPFGLPRTLSLRSEFGDPASRIGGWLEGERKKGRVLEAPDRGALYAACARLTTEHRLNSRAPPELMPGRPGSSGELELTAEQVAGWKAFLDEYHVNSIPVPSPRRYFRDPDEDREAIAAYLGSWDRLLDSLGRPDLLCYTYLIDEPNDAEAYAITRAWGHRIREAGSRVRVLVTEQTKPQNEAWGSLYGAVDIWVPLFSLFEPESAARRRELGEEIWTYTALCQRDPTPWWHIDYPLLHYRVPAWMAWLHHMKGLLYWGGMAHWRDVDDPWTDPATYRGKGSRRIVFNGEGSLLYPGWPAGVEGPLPSMRLKALRDGIEDFEYLAMLEAIGRRPVAEAMVRSVVASWYEWSGDPERYVQTRRKLGCLIADALKSRRAEDDAPSR